MPIMNGLVLARTLRKLDVKAKVIVSSAEVPKPVAVRYAWQDWPECNLVNAAGLPASPFRTDEWK